MKNYKNFINEEMVSFDTVFKTEVSDVTIYGLEETLSNSPDDVDISPSNAIVTWNLQPDMRQDRIKSMDLVVTRIECQIEWSIYKEGLNNARLKDNYIYFDTDSQDFKDWEIDPHIDFETDGGVCPDCVEIDYNYKKITIT